MAQTERVDSNLVARMHRWFRETLEIDEDRRIARMDRESILASKLPAGAAGLIFEILDRVPELLDETAVREAYDALTGKAHPEMPRVQCWHRSTSDLLRTAATSGAISNTERGLIQPGIDSVGGVMDAVLWTQPTVGTAYEPNTAERSAFLDATERVDEGRDMFTRVFGDFENRTVLNVCPGTPFARMLLEQAWLACTGTGPPEERPQT